MTTIAIRVPVLAALALALGCGGGMPNFGTPAPVRGKVALANGATPRGWRITFLPTDGKGKQVYADLAADGSFVLSTFAPKDGALPGQYVATLELMARSGQRVPSKYESRDESDLKVEVKGGQENVFEFKLR